MGEIESTTIDINITTDGCLEFSETFNVNVDPSVQDFYPNMTLPSTSTFTIMDMDGKLDKHDCVYVEHPTLPPMCG